jgi:hypothetical protein
MNSAGPVDDIRALLEDYTDMRLQIVLEAGLDARVEWDAVLEGRGVTFLVEFKRTSSTESVGSAVRELQGVAPTKGKQVPILVVPFMGEVGKELCRRAGVAWLDLSGNARITAPGMRITIEGKPNLFVERGRRADPFAPKASRITRTLLLNLDTGFTQAALAVETGLDKGFVSRIVQRLESAGLVTRSGSGVVRTDDPAKLLAAWRAAYDFTRHDIVRAVVAARSGPDALRRVSEGLGEAGLEHAATGLAAAWLYAPFAAYRTVTLYVRRRLDAPTLKRAGLRETAAGANVWIVVPNDTGVFTGGEDRAGIPCVSALQTYLDLKGHAERAGEAAEELRRVCLPWASA